MWTTPRSQIAVSILRPARCLRSKKAERFKGIESLGIGTEKTKREGFVRCVRIQNDFAAETLRASGQIQLNRTEDRPI